MNPNLLYKIALKKYEKASKAIDSLTKDVAGVFPDYDNKRALISFDYLLQCTLLKQALADGTISENELEFIKGISNHGDVLEEIKSSFDDTNVGGLIKKTTWNDIYYLGPVAQTALVNAISNFVQSYIDETALLCGVADALTRKNYYKVIANSISSILTIFAKIDGKKEKVELFVGTTEFVEAFGNSYLAMKELVQELVREGKELKKALHKDIKALRKEAEKYLASHKDTDIEKEINDLIDEIYAELNSEEE